MKLYPFQREWLRFVQGGKSVNLRPPSMHRWVQRFMRLFNKLREKENA